MQEVIINEKVAAFLDVVKNDAELQKKLAENNDVNSVIALAKERGFDLKEEDFDLPAAELSDDELDAVAGGGGIGICSCVGAGGGGGEDYDNGKTYGCACVGYGQGGDGRASDFNCFCVICGGSSDVDSF